MNKNLIRLHKVGDNDMVHAREIYKTLNIGRDFPTWIRAKIDQTGLIENKDFTIMVNNKGYGRPTIDYMIKIEAALKIIKSMRKNKYTAKVFDLLSKLEEPKENTVLTLKDNTNMKDNTVIIKENEFFGKVRFVIIEGREYAVARDIAAALGYSNKMQAIRVHCKGVLETSIPTKGGRQMMKIIPEGDIYRLITGSKLPIAKKFGSWVFDEVLPSIRRYGFYMNESTLDNMLNNPDFAIQLLENYKKEKAEKEMLLKEKEENKPKLMAYDDFINSDGLYNFSIAAKILSIPRSSTSKTIIGKNTLLSWLRRDNILMSQGEDRNIPYQRYIKQGIFEIKTIDGENSYSPRTAVRITPKGIEWLYKKYRYSNMPKKLQIREDIELYNQEQFDIAL